MCARIRFAHFWGERDEVDALTANGDELMSTWTRMVDQLSAVKLLISIRSKHHTEHAYSQCYSPMVYLHMLCAASAFSLVVSFALHVLGRGRTCILWMWRGGTLASTTVTLILNRF